MGTTAAGPIKEARSCPLRAGRPAKAVVCVPGLVVVFFGAIDTCCAIRSGNISADVGAPLPRRIPVPASSIAVGGGTSPLAPTIGGVCTSRPFCHLRR
jgi:hypothetical protein